MSGVLGPTSFNILSTAASGIGVHRAWLDVVSDNVANINTVRPTNAPAFQERHLDVIPDRPSNGETGGGVKVRSVTYGDAAGILSYEPTHPLADGNGYVRRPGTDLGTQMVEMVEAQRGFQANSRVFSAARELYAEAMQIGK